MSVSTDQEELSRLQARSLSGLGYPILFSTQRRIRRRDAKTFSLQEPLSAISESALRLPCFCVEKGSADPIRGGFFNELVHIGIAEDVIYKGDTKDLMTAYESMALRFARILLGLNVRPG
jgi:hypothetical protein